MKISEILAQAKDQLEKSGVSNSKLDSLILLTHALLVSKEHVIFNPDLELNQDQKKSFLSLVERRSAREPIAHIIGKREFYGRDFFVTKDALDPRPDSESLIELVLKKFPKKNQKIRILEIGSGSGCLVITLLKELPIAQAIALDLSEKALRICKKNADFQEVQDRLQLIKSDVFSALKENEKFDLIISNPPYISSKEIEELHPEVKIYEPRMALDGGFDGLDFYRQIANQSQNFLAENAKIILEIGFGQRADVEKIFNKENYFLEEVKQDLAGVERALCFQISSKNINEK